MDRQTDRLGPGAEGTGRYACAPSLLLQLLFWVLSHGTQGSYDCWNLIPPYFAPKALKGGYLAGRVSAAIFLHSALYSALARLSLADVPRVTPHRGMKNSPLFDWDQS